MTFLWLLVVPFCCCFQSIFSSAPHWKGHWFIVQLPPESSSLFYRNFTRKIRHRKQVGTMTLRCEFFITHQVSLCVLWQCRRSQEDKKSLFDIIPMDPTRRRLEGLKFVSFYARRQIIEKSHWAVSFGSLPGCSLSHSQWYTKVHRVRNDLQFNSGGLWSFWSFWTCQLKCQLSASNVSTCSLEHYANWPD